MPTARSVSNTGSMPSARASTLRGWLMGQGDGLPGPAVLLERAFRYRTSLYGPCGQAGRADGGGGRSKIRILSPVMRARGADRAVVTCNRDKAALTIEAVWEASGNLGA